VEDSVTNEGFCLALAASLKLNTARATIKHVQTHRFLLVERYDRSVNAQGQWQRLHQEDFCQAQGVVPELKYQNEGGPNFAQCFDLVRRVTQPSATHVLRLLDSVIFNVLIGNHDAHAKNFSLLYVNKIPTLAPLYDTLATAIYPHLTPKMAMKLGSKYRFSDVQARHWDQFAQSAGLSATQTRKRIIALAREIPVAAHTLALAPNFDVANHPLIGKILSVVDQRCALTLQRLV
jgi:serine/threonine-protein kinase HipA